jgi:1-phosphofructokinase
MVAGFVYGYLKSNDYKQAFIYGVCTGSASAFSDNLATEEEVNNLLKQWILFLISGYLLNLLNL